MEHPGRNFALATLVVAAAMLGAACGDDGDDPDGATSPTTATVSPTGGDGAAGDEFDGTRVEVEVREGAVVGGVQRVEVDTGEPVLLVVTADVADEVHVHGVDVTRDVGAGETVEVGFTADIPGVFEIELEERHLLLVRLVVDG